MISVVVPVFRSGPLLAELHRRVAATLDPISQDWELILVDDASGDGTFDAMLDLRRTDPRVHVVRFATNMGQHHATLCGLKRARGDHVITLDDDLQNPPEQIPAFIAKLDEGYDAVIGKIGHKQHSLGRRAASRLVQSFLSWILGKPSWLELTSFRALTPRAIRGMTAYTGAHVYLPALMLDAVPIERITNIPVEHHARRSGTSQYTLRKLLRLFSYLIINHSYAPLRFVTVWGFLLCGASFSYAAVIVFLALVKDDVRVGFPSIATLISFLSGSILLCMGILGEYIGRLVDGTSQPRQFPVFEEDPASGE